MCSSFQAVPVLPFQVNQQTFLPLCSPCLPPCCANTYILDISDLTYLYLYSYCFLPWNISSSVSPSGKLLSCYEALLKTSIPSGCVYRHIQADSVLFSQSCELRNLYIHLQVSGLSLASWRPVYTAYHLYFSSIWCRKFPLRSFGYTLSTQCLDADLLIPTTGTLYLLFPLPGKFCLWIFTWLISSFYSTQSLLI